MSTSIYLFELLDTAAELAAALEDDWPKWRDQLLLLLTQLDAKGESESLDRDIRALIADLYDQGGASEIIGRIVERHDADIFIASSARRHFPAPSSPPAPERVVTQGTPVESIVVPVFYATNRVRQQSSHCDYGSGRGELQYGRADVTIPLTHRIGRLEGPKLWRLELRADAERHVVVRSIEPLDHVAFTDRLSEALVEADEPDVLLFVHGYHVGFADALRRAGQMAHDLKFQGCVAAFSWPCRGNLLGYLTDGENAEWSRSYFREALDLFLRNVGARKVHIIAHSMGNRLLIDAIDRLGATTTAATGRLGQVVFAAPDVDADSFWEAAARVSGRAMRLTLYLSSNDVALRVSRWLHGYGRAGARVVIVDGVDTVDASQVDTSLVGLRHSYYGDKRSILSDLHSLINTNLDPARRFDIEVSATESGSYWTYRA